MRSILKIYGASKNSEVYEKMLADFKAKGSDPVTVYNKYLPFLWQTDSSLYTVKNRYQDFKEIVEADGKIGKRIKAEILKIFTLDETFFSLLNKRTKKRNDEKVSDQKTFSIDTYLETMKKIRSDIENKDFEKYKYNENGVFLRRTDEFVKANLGAAYLAMNTGRRQAEIFVTLDIVKFGKQTFFIDLAKKRDDNEKVHAVLLDEDYKFSKECLKAVREQYSTLKEPKQLNNIKKSVNGFLDDTLGNDLGSFYYLNKNSRVYIKDEDLEQVSTDHTISEKKGLSYSLLRDMYVSVSTKMLKPEGMADEMWKHQVLNHKVSDDRARLGSHYDKTKGE